MFLLVLMRVLPKGTTGVLGSTSSLWKLTKWVQLLQLLYVLCLAESVVLDRTDFCNKSLTAFEFALLLTFIQRIFSGGLCFVNECHVFRCQGSHCLRLF